jgi:hypothetical protein
MPSGREALRKNETEITIKQPKTEEEKPEPQAVQEHKPKPVPAPKADSFAQAERTIEEHDANE